MNSASLTKGQRDYCASYREAVALAFAVEHLRYKIQPEKIHAYTDNSALIFIFGKTVENKPILKIAEFLDQQGITLTHIKGSDNGGSDSLSRIHTAFINSGWRLIPDAELASYVPHSSFNKPYLLNMRIPAAAELVLLLFSGGNHSKMTQMENDEREKWMLATAQVVEGINLIQQAVRTNAILTREEALGIIFGNTRTQYTKQLFQTIQQQKDEFPNIQIELKGNPSKEKTTPIVPIALAHHITNLLNNLQTILETSKTGHIKDWGVQIETKIEEFEHPPLNIKEIAKSTDSKKITCLHVKYDGKAKQPNDPINRQTRISVCDNLTRGWINKPTQALMRQWFREDGRILDPFHVDSIESINICIDIVRDKLNITVYAMKRIILINNNLLMQFARIVDETILNHRFSQIFKRFSTDKERAEEFRQEKDRFFSQREDVYALIHKQEISNEQLRIFKQNESGALIHSIKVANFENAHSDPHWMDQLPI